MSNMEQHPPTTDELHAYADGKLPPARAEEIAAYLSDHPKAARDVADYRRINQMIRSVVDDVLDEPLPSAQAALVRDHRPGFGRAIAAALAGLLVGGSLGWYAHAFDAAGRSPVDQLASRSSAAYVVYGLESNHPVDVDGGNPGRLAAWLSSRMGMKLKIPRLGDLDLTLIGGRLMIGETAPAALLMYEDPKGRRIVLYVRNDLPAEETTKMRYLRKPATGVVVWLDGAAGFALAGDLSEKELMPAANLIRAQLSL